MFKAYLTIPNHLSFFVFRQNFREIQGLYKYSGAEDTLDYHCARYCRKPEWEI